MFKWGNVCIFQTMCELTILENLSFCIKINDFFTFQSILTVTLIRLEPYPNFWKILFYYFWWHFLCSISHTIHMTYLVFFIRPVISRNTHILDPKNIKIIKVTVILYKMTVTLMILIFLGSNMWVFLLITGLIKNTRYVIWIVWLIEHKKCHQK